MIKKILSVFLIAALSLCSFAEETPETPTEIVEVEEKTAAEEPKIEVVVTPEPTPAPTPEPTPEPTPVPTPEPTPEPVEEPTATPEPEPTVEPTPEVTPVPEATEEPTVTPEPEVTPEPTVEPTVEPTAEPTPEVTPTPEATETPVTFYGKPLNLREVRFSGDSEAEKGERAMVVVKIKANNGCCNLDNFNVSIFSTNDYEVECDTADDPHAGSDGRFTVKNAYVGENGYVYAGGTRHILNYVVYTYAPATITVCVSGCENGDSFDYKVSLKEPEVEEVPVMLIADEEVQIEEETEEPLEESNVESIADVEIETAEVPEDTSDVQTIEVISEVIVINEEAEESTEGNEESEAEAQESAEESTGDSEESEEELQEVVPKEGTEDTDLEVYQESSEIVDEPIMMAPMMMMAAAPRLTSTSSRTPNDFGGYDYDEDGHKYEADDYHRYGFNFLVFGLDHTTLYADDANNSSTITFAPRIRDDDTQFEVIINGKTVDSAGIISSIFKRTKTFELTYAELYKAMEDQADGNITVTINCYSNACREYEWNSKKERWDKVSNGKAGIYGDMWHNLLWVKKVSITKTFTKYSYAAPSITISADKTSVYPGDKVILTATSKIDSKINNPTTTITWYINDEFAGTGSTYEFVKDAGTYSIYATLKVQY